MRLTSRITVVVGLVLGVGACKFPELPPIDEDGAPGDGSAGDGAPGDGGDPDAATACVPEAESCADGRYTRCDATGNFVQHLIPNGGASGEPITITMDDYECPMGCHTAAPRCADIALGNGVEVALDTPAVSPSGQDIALPGVGAPSGSIVLDTGAFNSTLGVLRVTDTNGAMVDLPAQIVEQGGEAGAVLVIKARTFTVRSGSTIRARGPRSLAIVSHFGTYIAGTIDASAEFPPGGAVVEGGPGARSSGSCSGASIGATTGATGGAGGACLGGAASSGASGGAVSAVSPPFVVGGCPGGRGSGPLQFGSPAGGGLLLASRTSVRMASSAILDLTGAGGSASSSYATGGSSGGNALLMAPLVRVATGAIISTRGGSGGAASATGGTWGSPGPVTGGAWAPGATCAGCGSGGSGGYEASCSGGSGSGSAGALGGGGGAAGHCAIYSVTGASEVAVGATRCVRRSEPLAPRSP